MKKNIFTRMTAVLLTVTAAAAQCAYVCGASALTKEELCVKYAAKTEIMRAKWLHEYGTELEDPFEDLTPSTTVKIDASGMGDDGVFYGEEYARKKYLKQTQYLYQEWGSTRKLYLGDCSYSDGFYYLEKPDGTAMILGADYDYMNEQKTETLIIPETIGGLTVTEIGENAFDYFDNHVRTVKEIVVPSTVTKIRNKAFHWALGEGCKINLPENIEYLGAFSYSNVKNALGDVVVLPETLEYCHAGAFSGSIIQEMILPESCVFCDYGAITYNVDGTYDGRRTVWFPNCVTVDDEFFSQENAEGLRAAAAQHDEESEHPELVYYPFGNGDSDCNGKTDVSDSVLLARYCSEDEDAVLTAEGKTNSDTTGDGALAMDDVTETLKIVAKLK